MKALSINAKITYHKPYRQFNELYKIDEPIIFPKTENMIEYGRYDLGVFFLPILRVYDGGAIYIYNNGLKKSFFVDDIGNVFESNVIIFRDLSIDNAIYLYKNGNISLEVRDKLEDLDYILPELKTSSFTMDDVKLMLNLLSKFNTLNCDKLVHYNDEFKKNFKYQMHIQYHGNKKETLQERKLFNIY